MKISGRTLAVCMLLACGCIWSAGNVSAKVCFVGDPDCAGGADFGDYVDPAADGDLCKQEGYILKADCDANPAKHVTGFCPYNSDYVMCCGKEYTYDACVYPHMPAGKCGKKYRCVCDPAKYPYTESQCHSSFKFSNPGGTACTQIDPGPTDTVKTLYYSACLCERGLYPYSKQDCQSTANADVNGEPCVDSQGNSYWDSCKCSNPPYVWESVDCEFGGKGKACVQGGVYFFKECCSCAAFPAEGERGGRPNDVHATKWTTCDCPRKGRFKITQCAQGWQPNKDGSACERISCENAVKLFFSKNKDKYPSYAVFTGDKLVNHAVLTDAEKARLPEAQQTYAVGAEIENNTAVYGVLARNVSVTSKYCSAVNKPFVVKKCTKAVCTACSRSKADRVLVSPGCGSVDKGCERTGALLGNKRYCTDWNYTYNNVTEYQDVGGYEMGCTKAARIYSGAYMGTLGSTADHKMLQEACGSYEPEKTVVPTLSFSGSAFPNTNSRTASIYFYGAELKFSGTTSVNRVLSLTNTTVSGSGATFTKEVNLTREEKLPNGEKTTFAMSSSTFKNKLTSNGYNFDIGSLYLEVPDSYKNKEFANFKFQGGETVEGGKILFFPSDKKISENWGSWLTFKGNSSGTETNVYTNVYVGVNSTSPSKTARSMYIKLSGNLIWNLYKDSSNYSITLSGNSAVMSQDYGSGNYAKIKYGSNKLWRHCSMAESQLSQYVDGRKFWGTCKGKNRWNSDYNIVCSVNQTGHVSLNSKLVFKQESGRAHKCDLCYTQVSSSCGISFNHKYCGATQQLLTCGE